MYPNRNTGGQLSRAQSTNNSVDSGLGSLEHDNWPTVYNNSGSFIIPLQTNRIKNDSARGRGRGRGSMRGTGGLSGGDWNSSVSDHNEVMQ